MAAAERAADGRLGGALHATLAPTVDRPARGGGLAARGRQRRTPNRHRNRNRRCRTPAQPLQAGEEVSAALRAPRSAMTHPPRP